MSLSWLSAAVVCAVFSAGPCAAAHGQRPNIVVIVSDDHAHDALGCAGHRVLKTPSLDRLANAGVRFTHCFVPNPICTPARAALLTGQDNWTNGCYFFGMPIHEESPLWPQLLAEAGYRTFFTGKWHYDGRPEERGFTHGANIWLGGGWNHVALPVVQYGQPKEDRKPLEKFSSAAFVDAAIEFIEGNDRPDDQAPFCLLVSFTDPHDPWTPPDEYAAMYRDQEMPLPENFMPRPSFQHGEWFEALRDQKQVPFPRTQENIRAALALYNAMITHMDAQIGRLLHKLDELQLSDNTFVIFVGDHGYSLGSQGFVGKQCMYEEGIRTPLIVRFPKWKRDKATNELLVSLVDLFPTICEAADVKSPKSVEGRSLRGLYQGHEDPSAWREEIYAAFHSPQYHHMSTRCIRTRRHKYVQHLLTGEEELFDLQIDPHELHNLASDAKHATLLAQLKGRLSKWGVETPQHTLAQTNLSRPYK